MADKPTYEELEQTVRELEQQAVERKHVEEALRESEEKLSGIITSITDHMSMIDEEHNIVWTNDVTKRLFGPDLVGKKCYTAYHRHDKPCDLCVVRKCFEDGKVHEHEIEAIGVDGNQLTFWCAASVAARDKHGQPKMVVEVSRNITERKLAEKALVQAKEDWENTFDATTDMIMLLDDEHQVLRVNKAAAEALHTTKESFIGKKCYEAIHERSRPIRKCPLQLTMKTLEPHTAEITEPHLGGTFMCSTSPILDREGKLTGYTHSLKDITESKRLEAQFQQAQRLESIGTLAGGIAHDFNNLLMGIQGNVSLMLLSMDSTHQYYKRLKNVEKQVESGARLTSYLLGYARKGKYEIKPVDLNQLVEEICEAFARTRKQITIRRELADDLFPIEADSRQIEQVVLNLLVNAADAMPGGGDLILKTMNVTQKDMMGKLYEPKPGNYVLLTVTDTGSGMDKETKERIFDPFFTTKEMGRGTGLGLASAYGILKAHRGYIDVESKKGQGTTFSIYLPASEKEVQRVVRTAEEVIEGTGTILLVDDEQVILEVGQDLLEAMGYRVLTADNGEEAVEIYRKNRDDIDIVVLDMVMPTMGGGEAYDRMKEINPDIKVLLSSGYSIDGEATEILERGCNGFIQKPFNMKELSGKIRKVLDKK